MTTDHFSQAPARSGAARLVGGVATPLLRTEYRAPLLVALLAFAVYAATAAPGALDGDSGEFQYMPRLLGLPHPTGYPLYLLLGWGWSWLPVGTLAFRFNLFSAFWAAVTLSLLFVLLRRYVGLAGSLGGALVLATAPTFWRYSGVAAVYSLHTALMAAALLLWLRWGESPGRRSLLTASVVTGLGLTNHPTFLFLVPAVLLFVLLSVLGAGRSWPRWRRDLLLALVCLALPGALYLYVPLRLWELRPGPATWGLPEVVARGIVTPFVRADLESIVEYITGQSLMSSYRADWWRLGTDLPALLAQEVSLPLLIVGGIGAAGWLRRPRGAVLLAGLFLPAAAYAATYGADFAERDQIAHLEAHLLPSILVLAIWIGAGVDLLVRLVRRLTAHRLSTGWLSAAAAGALLLVVYRPDAPLPTAGDRELSRAIERYWTEVLAYPLEEGAALTAHWGDLTAFWYFQHGRGLRPDLWAIFPPDPDLIDTWLSASRRPLYLAGPLLGWSPEMVSRYDLTPWGILVRVAPHGMSGQIPSLTAREAEIGESLRLLGYHSFFPAPDRLQIWLAWETRASTPRDLALSLRIHGPDGALKLQQDGRLASLWYPEGTLPEGQLLLSVFDLTLSPDLPPDGDLRLVVYDPQTIQPWLTPDGQDVVLLGRLAP